jgi:hypothetical protein
MVEDHPLGLTATDSPYRPDGISVGKILEGRGRISGVGPLEERRSRRVGSDPIIPSVLQDKY